METPGGKNVLYDTGILSFNQNSAESVLLPELKARNIKQLDAVILSHPHSDHIGGITTLIHQIPIKVIYESGLIYDSATYRAYRAAAGDLYVQRLRHAKVHVARPDGLGDPLNGQHIGEVDVPASTDL